MKCNQTFIIKTMRASRFAVKHTSQQSSAAAAAAATAAAAAAAGASTTVSSTFVLSSCSLSLFSDSLSYFNRPAWYLVVVRFLSLAL